MARYDYITSERYQDDMTDNNIIDALFIRDHWRFLEGDSGKMYCLKFDKEARLCTVHNEKPPVCRGFPWYGKEPNPKAIEAYPNCSFWSDINDLHYS